MRSNNLDLKDHAQHTWPIMIHPCRRSSGEEGDSRTRPASCPNGAIHVFVTLSSPITYSLPVSALLCCAPSLRALAQHITLVLINSHCCTPMSVTLTDNDFCAHGSAPCARGAYDVSDVQASWAMPARHLPGAPRAFGLQGFRGIDLQAVACLLCPHSSQGASRFTGVEQHTRTQCCAKHAAHTAAGSSLRLRHCHSSFALLFH